MNEYPETESTESFSIFSSVIEFHDGELCFLDNIILQNFLHVLVEFSLDLHVVYTAQFWRDVRT